MSCYQFCSFQTKYNACSATDAVGMIILDSQNKLESGLKFDIENVVISFPVVVAPLMNFPIQDLERDESPDAMKQFSFELGRGVPDSCQPISNILTYSFKFISSDLDTAIPIVSSGRIKYFVRENIRGPLSSVIPVTADAKIEHPTAFFLFFFPKVVWVCM